MFVTTTKARIVRILPSRGNYLAPLFTAMGNILPLVSELTSPAQALTRARQGLASGLPLHEALAQALLYQ